MFFKKRKEKSKIIHQEFKNSSVDRKNKNFTRDKEPGFLGQLFFKIICLAFLAIVIYVLFFSNFLLINSIAVEGAINIDLEIIKEIAQKEIEGKFFKYLEKSNFIILNTGEIRKNIAEKYKIIEEVRTKREFPDKLRIIISERKPALIIFNANKCFILDEKGVIFDESECDGRYLKINDLPILSNEKNKEITVGENYLEPGYIDFLMIMRRAIADDLEIELEKEMRTPSIISSDIRLKTKEGWEIYLNEKLGYKKELEMLQTILENKITSEQRKDLEYIDLRTENKVYYRFKNAETKNNQEENSGDSEKGEELKDAKNKNT